MVSKKQLKALFSDRYSKILTNDDFKADLSYDLSLELYKVLYRFDEGTVVTPDRYSNFQQNTRVSVEALTLFFEKHSFPIIYLDNADEEWFCKKDYAEQFEIIELWAIELSDGEQTAFHKEINEVFEEFDQPWRLLKQRIIKIDSMQFEIDLVQKTVEAMSLRINGQPIFQNACNEYIQSTEFFTNKDYKNCVLHAEMSYESVMKILSCQTDGQADSLTKAVMATSYMDDIPPQLKKEGVRLNVMMALPYLRNQLKVGHGEGGENIIITPALANLCLCLSSSLCVFLIKQYASRLPNDTVTDVEDTPF